MPYVIALLTFAAIIACRFFYLRGYNIGWDSGKIVGRWQAEPQRDSHGRFKAKGGA